jgi:Spy/CpxP family protein refolding chaperone
VTTTLKIFSKLSIVLLCIAGSVNGQQLGRQSSQQVAQMQLPPPGELPPPPRGQRPPGRGGPPGRWWDNPDMVKKLGMTSDQVRKMDEIFQQMRFKLIDLNGNLRKEEATLEPLMQADRPDDAKLLPQIDRVANARAELEKVNARLLLAIRHVLTVDQWKKLQSEDLVPPAYEGRPRRGRDQANQKNPEELDQ